MDDLYDIDKILAASAKTTILHEMGLPNLNNYLILDERQEEAKRLAANTTPKKFSEMVGKLNEAFTGGLTDASTLFEVMCRNSIVFQTGVPELDALLHDGLNNNKITEITGLSGSGKTRFCSKLMLNILASTSEKIIYLDSGTSFSFEKLEYYCNKFGMTRNAKDKDILHSRVKHAITRTPKDLLLALISIIESIQKGLQLTYIIVDSFSSIMNITGELSDFEESLSEVYRLFKYLNSQSVGILVTTIAKPFTSKTQKPKSILTTPWNFMPQTTILIDNIGNEAKSDSQKGFYKMTILSSEYSDDLPSVMVQLNMHPKKKAN